MQLLKIRYFQYKRDLGIWAPVVAVLVFLIANEATSGTLEYGLGLAGVGLLIIGSFHYQRKDLNFIKKYFLFPDSGVILNYNLLILPLTIGLAVNEKYLIAACLHLLISVFSFMRFKSSNVRLERIIKLIPSFQFEWISGIRKSFPVLVLLLLLAIALSPVKLFGVGALLLINSIFIGFYSEFEPLLMLNPNGDEAAEFLRKKVSYLNKVVLAVNVPLLVINSIFHPEVLSINACFLLAFILLGSCSVYIKYAHFEPNGSIPFNIDLLILYGSVFIPYLLPLSIILYFTNKKKAIHNLKRFTDDRN